MAGLEQLVELIYHEKQEGMLCAQHSLNALLQGAYFTAPDLSQIAQRLDDLESSYDDDHAGKSTNMDDTGFFSVQVLENALAVWGLTLVRWRSEQMKPYQDHPHTQLAFILNYQQHWYTLRRFGPASADLDSDPGDGHWFNLNSELPGPEWVGKLYLGMVLAQAEADGYSVFAVLQADPTANLGLSRTEADEVAETLPEPQSAGIPNPHLRAAGSSRNAFSRPPALETGFEDEDYELQAALQASMEGITSVGSPQHPPPVRRTLLPLPESGSSSPEGPLSPLGLRATAFEWPSESNDPVAASMARSRAMLDEMREEQEYARNQVLQQSQMERAQRGYQGQGSAEMDAELNDAEFHNFPPGPEALPHPSDFVDRVYDDDDAELQAALKASLEHVPEGWIAPEFHSAPPSAPPSAAIPAVTQNPVQAATTANDDDDAMEGDDEVVVPRTSEPALSVEEIRQRRLARFGG